VQAPRLVEPRRWIFRRTARAGRCKPQHSTKRSHTAHCSRSHCGLPAAGAARAILRLKGLRQAHTVRARLRYFMDALASPCAPRARARAPSRQLSATGVHGLARTWCAALPAGEFSDEHAVIGRSTLLVTSARYGDHLPQLRAPVHPYMSGPGALWRDERGKRPRTSFSRFFTGDDACWGGVH